jgi:hypothetical protein
MSNSIRIYTFYYKESEIPIQNDQYIPILAGKILNNNPNPMQGDDSGESISKKNPWYSELTGIYWVWKNTNQDITGCCHYRRYFTAKHSLRKYPISRFLLFLPGRYVKDTGLIYAKNTTWLKRMVITDEEIVRIFRNHDAILPEKRRLKRSVREQYQRHHSANDLIILEDIIRTFYAEYLDSFYSTLDSNWLYANNMFILRDNHFHNFMVWWFNILFEFEKRINLNDYKEYQERILGFLGERLLTIWFIHEKLKIKELPLIYIKRLKKV